jgi:hypothetical protein
MESTRHPAPVRAERTGTLTLREFGVMDNALLATTGDDRSLHHR